MATQSALSAKIDSIAATLAAEIEQIKAALESKVPAEIDLSEEIAKLDAIELAIAGIIPDASDDPTTKPTPAPEGVDVGPVEEPAPDALPE